MTTTVYVVVTILLCIGENMEFIFDDVIVTGIACSVPNNYVGTDEYIDNYGDKVIQQFKKTTGINGRHLSNGKQTAADLCYVAAKQLMEKKNLTGDDIDALILITQYPDYWTPSTSFVLHKRLEIKKECLVFDMNLGCSAFVNGIALLSGLIHSGAIKRALLLVGDAQLKHPVLPNDTSGTMMFGDAGSACILEKGKGNISGIIKADGTGFDVLIQPVPGARFYGQETKEGLGKMSGEDTFLFTITEVPRLFKEYLKKYEYSIEDFDYCILHQANMMIMSNIAKRIKLPTDKMPVSIDRYGNTDGASIPVTIVDLCEKLNEDNKELNLIMSGYGIGLSWGVVSFKINTNDVLPMIFTDDYYEEGFLV